MLNPFIIARAGIGALLVQLGPRDRTETVSKSEALRLVQAISSVKDEVTVTVATLSPPTTITLPAVEIADAVIPMIGVSEITQDIAIHSVGFKHR